MNIEVNYKKAADKLTLQDVIKCYENGISIAVNDGQDITIIIEKGPNSLPAN